jgi:putative transposase
VCLSKNPEIADCVIGSLRYFDEQRYKLIAWCVMPNHVHVIAQLMKGSDLDSILHSWKSYTANVANGFLGRSGAFWWREYYDHCIRDEEELARTIRSVLENPIKAGLRDWPYTWCAG